MSHSSVIATLQEGIPPFVRFILTQLKQAGYDGVIVGGAPRDVLLGRSPEDWDVATPASMQAIQEIFRHNRRFSLQNRTVTLIGDNGACYEVTPYRGLGPLLEDDLAHRDFTINAIAFDPETGRIHDPFCGQADIALGRIRAVEDPAARFMEDPVRLLRAVRFRAELGFDIERRTQSALSTHAFRISAAARERIRDELNKILLTPRPSLGFNRMATTGLLEYLIPELLEGRLKRQNGYHRFTIFKHVMETLDHTEPRASLRLAALLHDVAKPRVRAKIAGRWRFYGHEAESARMAVDIMTRFRFGRETTEAVLRLIRHHAIAYERVWGNAAVRRLIRRVGSGHIMDLIALRRADLLAHGFGSKGSTLLDHLAKRVQRELRAGNPTERAGLSIDGNQVMAILGIPPGPVVGKILAELTERVIDRPDLNRRDRLTALVKTTPWNDLIGA